MKQVFGVYLVRVKFELWSKWILNVSGFVSLNVFVEGLGTERKEEKSIKFDMYAFIPFKREFGHTKVHL